MQSCSRFKIFFLLFTVLISGVFAFTAPQKVSATVLMNHDSASESMPMDQRMACVMGTCVIEHQTCEKHCVIPKREITSVVGALNSVEQSATCHQSDWTITQPACHNLFIAKTSYRPPPTHILLRSIMKRE